MNVKTVKTENYYQEILDMLDYIEEIELDDEQMMIIEKFKNLEQYEKDLLVMKSKGYSLRQMGEKLNISYGWCADHLSKIYKKLKITQE